MIYSVRNNDELDSLKILREFHSHLIGMRLQNQIEGIFKMNRMNSLDQLPKLIIEKILEGSC